MTQKRTNLSLTHNLRIVCYMNNLPVSSVITPETSALQFLRDTLSLTGTKAPCAEGDCGGCTIALGGWEEDVFRYQAVNSCILPATRLHGCHVITIEGLAAGKKLHLIQQEMLNHHAVQCGYCTSGMIMAIFCLLCDNATPSRDAIILALAGNLCRCTGYKFINDAVLAIVDKLKNDQELVRNLMPAHALTIQKKLKNIKQPLRIPTTSADIDICKNYYIPKTLQQLFALMRELRGEFSIINGGTDLMVQANVHDIWPEALIDISRLAQLNFIHTSKRQISIGGGTTLNQVQKDTYVQDKFPVLINAILQMASQQIRNVATLAGNIVNASPIADCVCVLLALDAILIIKSSKKTRRVKLEDFYYDYKATILNKKQEIILAIEIPQIAGVCDFIKTAKRTALDIATINSCINIALIDDVVQGCRIAIGGVAKIPALAQRASAFLVGKKITAQTITQTAQIAAMEFTPITDVRGKVEYRLRLIHNHIYQHFVTLALKYFSGMGDKPSAFPKIHNNVLAPD